jgi:acyl-CoA dehydrogenase
MILPRNIYDEEHLLFKSSVEDFINKEILPNNAQWENDHMVSRASWEKLGEAGFLCLQVPEQYGGMGITDFRFNAIFTEALGFSGCAGPAVGYPLHNDIVAPYILHYGKEETKSRILPDAVSGKKILAIAMTEPGTGSDLQGIKTTAIDQGDHYLINGSKTFITNGYLSDVVVVAAKTNPNEGSKGTSLLVVESGVEGYTKGTPFHKVGLHAQDTCELFFDNVKVPKSALLGKEGEGFKYLMTELAQERLVVGLSAIAAAEGALYKTIQYTKERKAFGKSISDFQNTRFVLAQLSSEIEMCRVYVDRCVQLHCEGKLEAAAASALKMLTTDLQAKVADECLQLFGGYGYIWEYDIARAWADARVQKIYAGTNEIMKEIVARRILA